jgi:hypothetical protein
MCLIRPERCSLRIASKLLQRGELRPQILVLKSACVNVFLRYKARCLLSCRKSCRPNAKSIPLGIPIGGKLSLEQQIPRLRRSFGNANDLLARNDIVRGNWTAAGLKAGPFQRNGKSVGQEWPTHAADGPISRKLGEKCGTRGAWKHEIIDRFAQDGSFVGHRHPLISLWACPFGLTPGTHEHAPRSDFVTG